MTRPPNPSNSNGDVELRRKLSKLTYLEPQYIEDLVQLIQTECNKASAKAYALEHLNHKRKLGLSLIEISKHLGISRPTLSKWLANPEMFTLGAIRKLQQLSNPEQPKEES